MSNVKFAPIHAAHTQNIKDIFKKLATSLEGLDQKEAQQRLRELGPNQLPIIESPGLFRIFCLQFINPLIIVLFVISILSYFIGHISDGSFILGVLFINAIIGTYQEFGAEQSAQSLRQLTKTFVTVNRGAEKFEVPSEEVVLGDIVLLESGNKIPADLKLINAHSLEIDESLLTGESVPVSKKVEDLYSQDTPIADRRNVAFAGTMVAKGRGSGIVVATAIDSELGKLACGVIGGRSTKTPLMIRMEKFTRGLVYFILGIIFVISAVLIGLGNSIAEVLLLAVAIAVGAIPEGLPVAMTVALSIASRRMSKKNVIVRNLAAVEALGSCNYIATDKTGTLTVNQLTANKIYFPGENEWDVRGRGTTPEGKILNGGQEVNDNGKLQILHILGQSITLCNEASLVQKDDEWVGHGDSVDVALLVLGHKLGFSKLESEKEYELVDSIPYESENKFAATLHRNQQEQFLCVKGAAECLLPMCESMLTADGEIKFDVDLIEEHLLNLAQNGQRVLAVACKKIQKEHALEELTHLDLKGLSFLGLVGLMDPLRTGVKKAIASSKSAGLKVAMITGDHPLTAFAVAKELELVDSLDKVVTGQDLLDISDNEILFDKIVAGANVFARVGPRQKLDIVKSLQRKGYFVAVTGDGANDAPALKAAHVGISMGIMGTDVARETSDLILTDDHFSSIVAGIVEGRIAYANIRKVIYLLVATGLAEIVLITLSILAGLPLPLTAVQLLWLNLVTNGIQDVALAFEKGEGDELQKAPRSPEERIFNRLMLERVGLSALSMGVVGFLYYNFLLSTGHAHAQAQNLILLLMVLFENLMIGNARSEEKSLFLISPLRNKFLLFATLFAQALHMAIMYFEPFQRALGVEPVTIHEWIECFTVSLSIIIVMEVHKLFKKLLV